MRRRRAPREKLLADRTPVAIAATLTVAAADGAVVVAAALGIVLAPERLAAARGRLHCCSV